MKDKYQIAWDIAPKDLIDCYAIIQKWTDQAISADLYRKLQGDEKVSSTEMLQGYFQRYKLGLKQRYYQNSLTAKGINMNSSEPVVGSDIQEDLQDDVGCSSGGCSL